MVNPGGERSIAGRAIDDVVVESKESEEGEGARQARHESRSAPCCEWLNTRSESRMRSNLADWEAEEGVAASNSGAGDEPHVNPCRETENQLGANDGLDRRTHQRRRFGDVPPTNRANIDLDVLLQVLDERRIWEVGNDDLQTNEQG